MSDTAATAVQPFAMLFTMNNALVLKGLHGLTDDEAWHQIEGRGNSVAWMVGHLVETREQLLKALGASSGLGWGGRFKRGAVRLERADYPTRAEVEAAFVATQEPVLAALLGLSAERLAQPTPVTVGAAKTMADLVAFFAFHEGYHVGQIGYVRRFLGHAALIG